MMMARHGILMLIHGILLMHLVWRIAAVAILTACFTTVVVVSIPCVPTIPTARVDVLGMLHELDFFKLQIQLEQLDLTGHRRVVRLAVCEALPARGRQLGRAATHALCTPDGRGDFRARGEGSRV
jgi:hypothetical protein